MKNKIKNYTKNYINNYQANKRRKELASRVVDLLQKIELIGYTDGGTLENTILVSTIDKTIKKLTGNIQLTDEEIGVLGAGITFASTKRDIFSMATSLSYASAMKESNDWINEHKKSAICRFIDELKYIDIFRGGWYRERRSDIPVPERWKDDLYEQFRTESTRLYQEISELIE